MPVERESTLILSIRNRDKAVSYSASDPRPDGSQYQGFKLLKGKPEDCALIPEVQDDVALKNALIVLNQDDTIFFTVACEKSCNQHGSGYQKKGYVEVASNDRGLATNAAYYFQLFYEFNRTWFWKQPQEGVVHYRFDLELTKFWKHQVNVFTMTVWICTGVMPSEETAQTAWAWALNTFVEFMRTRTPPPGYTFTPIF